MLKLNVSKDSAKINKRVVEMSASQADKEATQAGELMTSEGGRHTYVPDQESVQLRAYQLYQQQGGDAQANWYGAEKLLREESLGR